MHGSRWTLDRLASHVAGALAAQEETANKVLLAYSGGADSTALLLALLEVARRPPPKGLSGQGQPGQRSPGQAPEQATLEIVVAHVDHQLDKGSGQRAQRAQTIAEGLIVSARDQGHSRGTHRFIHLTPSPSGNRSSTAATNQGLEAHARSMRYTLLERLSQQEENALILTAHHDGDQLETLILRLRQGTGIHGLAGVQWRRKQLLRPLLGTQSQPGPLARDLTCLLGSHNVPWIEDPTNLDLALQRNLIRHNVLPTLLTIESSAGKASERNERDWCKEAQSLASTALRCVRKLDQRLTQLLAIERLRTSASLDFQRWLELPRAVQDVALHSLHRSLGLRYGPTRAARAELRRQIDRAMQPSEAQERCNLVTGAVGCACGGGWSWRVRQQIFRKKLSQRLVLVSRQVD